MNLGVPLTPRMRHDDRDVVAGVADETVDQKSIVDRLRGSAHYSRHHACRRLRMPADRADVSLDDRKSESHEHPSQQLARIFWSTRLPETFAARGPLDSVIELDAPADSYQIAALLRDNERFGIDRIVSRTYNEVVVAVSAQRLHSIAGKYTGKDDPVAIVRNQGIFPAPEEIVSPFAKAHFVGGDARGSHVMPLMPVPLNTPVTGMYCLPIVSCAGFSIDKDGRFSESFTDFFDNPAWDEARRRAQCKAIEMRSQGWSGAAMLPYSELEYGGFRDTVSALLKRFRLREERKPEAAE
jgi:hypothetical protein